MLRGLVNASMI